MADEPPAVAATRAALDMIDQHEHEIRAWAHLDATRALETAAHAPTGLLSGTTVGVKDIIDTEDMPTEYGSPIYEGHRPTSDASVVSLVRAAGAVVLGKTVTAELAWLSPGPTTNPCRPSHTPGGSSSGSAAAVAAGMASLALGTQTAGSIIRPASFCGILGYKPTYGTIAVAGVKQSAGSLDTIGMFARDVATLDRGRRVLTGAVAAPPPVRQPTFGLVRTELWDLADADCRAVVEQLASSLGALDCAIPDAYLGLESTHQTIQRFEMARSLAWEHQTHAERLSDALRAQVRAGLAMPFEEYAEARQRGERGRSPALLDQLFRGVDVLMTPGVRGEAPRGLSSTGDPIFCRTWTLLGLPTCSVPVGTGSSGLPIGVQLVGRPFADDALLRAASVAIGRR